MFFCVFFFFFFQAEDGIRDLVRSRGLGVCIRDRPMASHGDPVCIESYSENIPRCSYIQKKHVLGVDFVIYGARKARDPARVVDGVEVCRRDHQFSEKYLRTLQTLIFIILIFPLKVFVQQKKFTTLTGYLSWMHILLVSEVKCLTLL